MAKIFERLALLLMASFVVILSACGGTSSTPQVVQPTPPSVGTSPVPPPGPGGVPALSPTAAISTAGGFATVGQTVFAARCQVCHGDQGQGRTAPAVIGVGANIARYNTAGGLYNFISTTMPMNAPGSLSAQDYLSVTSFILVQNNLVKAETPISQEQLDNIKLK